MRILISLMYYRPHYSGLTIYTERLARALARRGHQVTVLTARYLPDLPRYEVKDGVTIIRPRVILRLSKGVIMPSMPLWAWRLVRQADVVNAHVPQPDAAILALFSRLQRKPVVLTYHSDLRLPVGLIHFLANQYAHLTNHISALLANVIVTNTRDFAEHSPFLRHYMHKLKAILTPIELTPVGESELAAFRSKFGLQPHQRIIGMFARLATEKGVEYLVQALPQVLAKHPDVRVLFAGQYQEVLGEEKYAQKLAPSIEQLGKHWLFLGNLLPEEQTAFFREAAVTVLPSINSTESFGMVQVESMVCGTPVIATDLPGVRQPVIMTGMGTIVPPRNAEALAQALIRILDEPNGYHGEPEVLARQFASDTIAAEYEQVFEQVIGSNR